MNAAPDNFFTDTIVGQAIGHSVGDTIALFRSDSLNPLTNLTANAGELNDARLNLGLSVATSFLAPAAAAERTIATAVANPVPSTLARVMPSGVSATTLGRPGAADVFVTAADDIAGMGASQISKRLAIPESSSGFRVLEFPTPQNGIASPVFRADPGFVGGGCTAGGAREFVIPNGPIPAEAATRIVK